MSTFTINDDIIRRLCQINSFPIPTDGMVFFGFRGCLPVDDNNHQFQNEHDVNLTEINYLSPRCTLVQWVPKDGKTALFPGSTVPNIKYVKLSKENNGRGANQLMTGCYKDYRKGVHKKGKPTAHDAFRQTQGHPIRRTADDFDFDNDDRVEFVNPYDNIHAAWCMGVDHDSYASAGCQVIVGYPHCLKRENKPDVGPWKEFKENAYNLQQNRFAYILLNGRDAQRAVLNSSEKMSARLRFGSKGDLVKEVQKKLKDTDFYDGEIDGDFGVRTIRAVLSYQTETFGPSADDGIVGPITASALGISWPEV